MQHYVILTRMENGEVRGESTKQPDKLRIVYLSETPIDENYPNGVLTSTKNSAITETYQ